MNHAKKVFDILKANMKTDNDKLLETGVSASSTVVKEPVTVDEIADDYFGCKYLTSSQVCICLPRYS
jgi:hypothetical protein